MSDTLFQDKIKAPNTNHFAFRMTLQNVVADNEVDCALEKASEIIQQTTERCTTFKGKIFFPYTELKKKILYKWYTDGGAKIGQIRITCYGCYCEVEVAHVYANGTISAFNSIHSFQFIKD